MYTIGVITWADPNQRSLNDVVYTTNNNYCQKHGYTYIDATDTLSDLASYTTIGDKDPHYYKLAIIRKYLDNFDYLIWFDSDIYICDTTFKLEVLIDNYLHYQNNSIWLSRAKNIVDSNCTAITIVKNCDSSKVILDTLLNSEAYTKFYRASFKDGACQGLTREEAAIMQYTFNRDKYEDTIIRAYIPYLWSDLPIIDKEIIFADNVPIFKFYSWDDALALAQGRPLLQKYYARAYLSKDDAPFPLSMCTHLTIYNDSHFCIHLMGHTNKAKYDAIRILADE